MKDILYLLERKFLRDHELLLLEDCDYVKSLKYVKPYNDHYKEYLVLLDNNGNEEEYIVFCKFK